MDERGWDGEEGGGVREGWSCCECGCVRCKGEAAVVSLVAGE